MDLWSTDVIAYLLLTGERTFMDEWTIMEYAAGRSTLSLDDLYKKGMSAQGYDFVQSLLQAQPENVQQRVKRGTIPGCSPSMMWPKKELKIGMDPPRSTFHLKDSVRPRFTTSTISHPNAGLSTNRHKPRDIGLDLIAPAHYHRLFAPNSAKEKESILLAPPVTILLSPA